MDKKNLDKLQETIGLKFHNPALLENALIHRSYLNEAREADISSNERLEFLGDAILEFIVSEWLYKEFPTYAEGNLTNIRSHLVQKNTLAAISKSLTLGENLSMSKGEADSNGRENPSLLSDCFEALIGAIYLDQGAESCRAFIFKHLKPVLTKLIGRGEFKDYKSLLQEHIQTTIKEPPVYKTISENGPDHNRTFIVGVFSQSKKLAQGTGKSKQIAEQEAARTALESFGVKM